MEWIGFIIAVATVGIYLVSVWRSAPQLIVRLGNAENLCVKAHYPEGEWAFSVSAERPVVLTECILRNNDASLTFHGAPLLEPIASGRGIGHTWKGSLRLEPKEFHLFPLRYRSSVPVDNAHVNVEFVVSLPPEEWRFPWSMFGLQPKRRTYEFQFSTAADGPSGFTIRVGPGESLHVFGPVAQRAVMLRGAADVDLTAIDNDGSYETKKVRRESPVTENRINLGEGG